MIFNQTVVYALRAMTILARVPDGVPLPARQLAERTGVPPHYLGKVMRQLVVAGLVRGLKGHGGGFALRRAPTAITLTDVLAAVNAAPNPGVCAFGWKHCDPSHPCPLHPSWSSLQESLEHWARVNTLGGVVDEPHP